jgi:hypothetical protein
MRIGGEAPRRQAHSFGRHQSHGDQTGHCHLGSSWHSSRYEAWINARPVLRAPYAIFDQSRSCCRTQDGTGRDLADRGVAPQGDQQFACQSDDHGFAQSWLGACRPRSIPLCQGTLALEHQPAPCQLDHAAAHPPIAGSSEPPFAALAPTFIWRACQATITRYSPLIPQLTGEHFMDEHVGGLDTDLHDPG